MPRIRPFISAVVLVVAAVGCNDSSYVTTAGSTLAGTWYQVGTKFTADANGATYSAPCLSATFAAITLDSARTFSVESVMLTQTGNVMQQPNDKLHLNGLFRGDSLALTVYIVHAAGGGSDPINVTLPPGSGETGICSA